VPLPTADFSAEDRLLLRAAFLRLIPRSDEAATRLYASFGLTDQETIDEGVRRLAALVDALDQPDDFLIACRESKRWHRDRHIAPDLGPAFLEVIEALEQAPTASERPLWRRLWAAIDAA